MTDSGRIDPASTPKEPTLLYAVKQVELAIRSRLDAVLRPHQITALQYTALTVLRHREGVSTAELARNSFVTAQTMGEMVETLQRRGLISRSVDPAHKRRMLISLTSGGHLLLGQCEDEVAALEDAMVSALTLRQRDAFRGYLDSCRTALDDFIPPR